MQQGYDGNVPATAPLFAALGDPVRLAMLARLCTGGPLSTMVLGQGIEVSRQAITKHLQVLEDAGLVSSDRVGRDRLWQMRPQQLVAAREYLDRMSAQWDTRLERLRKFVEEEFD
ncbi:MAG TPA: metalloregulator ArsR/SmtB family transcription factor [Dyella sp.]|uniref:ArsR/SmtB family transcription factor n=1 Tax=Dyella sp. TaxID=1869338 RepID=UPI002F93889F